MDVVLALTGGIAVIAIGVAVFFFVRIQGYKQQMAEREEELKHRVYEAAILREVSERVGHSLDISNVTDVIIGSLSQFIDYHVASYMLCDQDRLLFRADLAAPVSRSFVDEMKQRMSDSLSTLLEEDVSERPMEETITGAIMSHTRAEPVRSFFNIPLIIGGSVVGVLTVADAREGMFAENDMTLLYKIVNQASGEIAKLKSVLAAEQHKVHAMVESITEGIIMTDTQYRIVVANPAARNALHLTNETELSVFDVASQFGDALDVAQKLEQSMEQKTTAAFSDVPLFGRTYEVRIIPVTSEDMEEKDIALGSVLILRDITTEKEAERMRQDFTAMMVHELRAPLDGIAKMGEYMLYDDNVRTRKTAYARYVGMIQESAQNMLTLVTDLLDVARLETGKLDLETQEVEPRELLEDVRARFDSAPPSATMTLSQYIADDVPETVMLDPRRFKQLTRELIAHAFERSDGKGEINICMFTHHKGHTLAEEASQLGVAWQEATPSGADDIAPALVVAVIDTAPALSHTEREQLFDKIKQFEIARKQEEKEAETGLGLVIARGIAEMHGGALRAGSGSENGNTFYALFPLQS